MGLSLFTVRESRMFLFTLRENRVGLSLFTVRVGEQGESIFVYCEGGRAG